MDILVCVACTSGTDPKLWFGDIFGSVVPTSRLTLLHVVPRGDQGTSERRLAKARETLMSESVQMIVRQGSPGDQILAELKERDYDLVVLGPNETPALKQHILGSVTTQVVRHAPTSVLIAQQARPPLDRILICSGGADVAERVVKAGAWLARAVEARVTLLHVVTPVASMYTGLGEIDETLSELLQTNTPIAQHLRRGAEILDEREVPAELKLRYGVPADEISREAHQGNYDLIVLGATKRVHRLKRWMLGDVTQQVVERAGRSILVVKRALPPDSDA